MAINETASKFNYEVIHCAKEVLASTKNDDIKARWNALFAEIVELSEQNVQLTMNNLSKYLPQRSNRLNHGRIMFKLLSVSSELCYYKKQRSADANSFAFACVAKLPAQLIDAFILQDEERNVPSNQKYINAMRNLLFKSTYT